MKYETCRTKIECTRKVTHSNIKQIVKKYKSSSQKYRKHKNTD